MSETDAAAWVAQAPWRLDEIERRARELVRAVTEEHYRRLVLDWAARDRGPIPSRLEAHEAAMAEIEIVCRVLGRLAALSPREVFPEQVVTQSRDVD